MTKKFVQPGYNDAGQEIPDPRPVEMPIGFQRPPSLQETIQRLVRNELSDVASAGNLESFEEADDFDVEEEEFTSPYELTEMQEESILEVPQVEGERKEHGREDVVDKGGRSEAGKVHSSGSERSREVERKDGVARDEGSGDKGAGRAAKVEG